MINELPFRCEFCGTETATTSEMAAHQDDCPDLVWHGLSPAAKADWVRAMQPEPPVPLTPLDLGMDDDDVARVVRTYVAQVQRNGTRDEVLDAYRHDGAYGHGSHYDLAGELAEVAASLGFTVPDVDAEPERHDRFMDLMLDECVPAVDRLLRGDV